VPRYVQPRQRDLPSRATEAAAPVARAPADSAWQTPHRLAHLQPTASAVQLAQETGPTREPEHEVGDTPRSSASGLPEQLQTKIEATSGHSLAGVRVFRDSSEPVQLHAHAFTRGTDIHLAPGQERHLAHEAWHVVQQLDGRVQADSTVGDVGVNTSSTLEQEADRMGQQLQSSSVDAAPLSDATRPADESSPVQKKHAPEALREASLPFAPPHRLQSEVVQLRANPNVVQMAAPASLGLMEASHSASDNERMVSSRKEEADAIYMKALANGQKRFNKLAQSNAKNSENSTQTDKPPPLQTTEVAGDLKYTHTACVIDTKEKMIRVSTKVHLEKSDSFETTPATEPTESMTPQEKRHLKQQNAVTDQANKAPTLEVAHFINMFHVKNGEVTEVRSSDNAKTTIEQEGGRAIKMSDVIQQQANVATQFKNKHVKGWFNNWKSASKAADFKLEGEQSPGKISDNLVFERTPTPSTDTAQILALFADKDRSREIGAPERTQALWGTAHATAPFYIALENGIAADKLSAEIASGGKVVFKLGEG